MRLSRMLLAAAAVGALLAPAITACSDSQVASTNAVLDKYDHSLDNFNTIVARYNQSISKTDATARPYCDQAKQTGTNVGKIVKNNDTAMKALDALGGALNAYCTAPINDVGTAVVVLTQAIADGKAALKGS